MAEPHYLFIPAGLSTASVLATLLYVTVVNVADGHAACCPRLVKDIARLRRNIHEAFSSIPRKKHGLFVVELRIVEFDSIQVMTLRDEEILEAVVVVVQKADAPARVQ
jgi:hypothetical protein